MVSEMPHEAARKFTVVLAAFNASLSFHAMLSSDVVEGLSMRKTALDTWSSNAPLLS